MIHRDAITIGNGSFVRTYSDAGRYVVRDGQSYVEATDPADLAQERDYAEGDPIPDDEEAEAEDYEAALAELGVE